MSASLKTHSDEQLAAILIDRNRDDASFERATSAFTELYERHSRWLLSYLAGRVKWHDLDDVHQVVWQRVWERVETGFRGGRFQVWLFFIARNHLIDLGRRLKMELLNEFTSSTLMAPGNGPEQAMEEADEQAALERCLSKLGGEAAEVAMRRLRGESYETITTKLAITRGKAYKLLRQARVALTGWLDESLHGGTLAGIP